MSVGEPGGCDSAPRKFNPPGCLLFQGRVVKGTGQPRDLLSLFLVTVLLSFCWEIGDAPQARKWP